MAQQKPSRREFCARTCIGFSAAALGGTLASLLQGCNTFTYPTPVQALQTVKGAESGRSIAVSIDSASPLAAVGGAALVESSFGPLLVVRKAADTFTALNGTCTHQVCTITGYSSQVFICPCHGSEFDTSGKVINGPARIALAEHATQLSNNVLTITL